MKEIVLNAEIREERGKGFSARMRREGMIPSIAYGPKAETLHLKVKSKEIGDILRSAKGESSLINLKIADKKGLKSALIKELQVDPVKDTILHIDFYLISADTAIKTTAKLLIVGEAPGVKDDGGILTFATRELEIECLPDKIPDHIEVDISSLGIQDMLRVKDLKVPEDIKVLSDSEQLIVNVVPPAKEEVVEEVVPEEEEAEEKEEVKEEAKKEEEKKEGAEEKEA